MASFNKYSPEVTSRIVDFSNISEIRLEGKTISSSNVKVYDKNQMLVPSILVSNSVIGNTVRFTVQNGTEGESYWIHVTAVFSSGESRIFIVNMNIWG